MIVYSGIELKNHVRKTLNNDFKERFLMKELLGYISSPNDRKVCCLYGLRRTGKTIMALQTINTIDDYEKCILIECEDNDNMHSIKTAISPYPEATYIFIDEVTKANDFINTCSFLANKYAAEGIKIVMAGTDSLGFFLAKTNELYDRSHFIHTTYIPYNEYNYLLEKNILTYIEYGGTLTRELTDENAFYNNHNKCEYTNTAIVYNIVHSLEKWNGGVNYGTRILGDITRRGELPSFINKVIEMPDRLFLARIINDAFKSHDLGSLADLMTKSDIADAQYIKTEEMSDRVRAFLGIKEQHFNITDDEAVESIIQYLKELDVLYQVPCMGLQKTKKDNEYIFTQTGMRYCQATALAEALVTSEEFLNYTLAQQHQILEKLKENICGGILEDIVFYQIARIIDSQGRNDKSLRITKYQNVSGGEIDILVLDLKERTSLAMEVKLSGIQDNGQLRHLQNLDLCEEIECKTGTAIVNKVVIYNGETANYIDGTILYINVEDFLKSTHEYLNLLLYTHIDDCYNLKQFKE